MIYNCPNSRTKPNLLPLYLSFTLPELTRRTKSAGTGIFVTPTTVFHYTHSVGIKMLVWLCGSIAAIAGTLIYIEFGLTTPSFGRNEITVPRNHYVCPSYYFKYLLRPVKLICVQLKDIFKRPAFFTNCLFGVILGIRVLEAAGYGHKISTQTLRETVAPGGPDNWKARVIAIVVVTFAVILHVTSRQAGIIVNNAFAIIKVLILLFIITGFVLQGNGFEPLATAIAEG